MSEAPAAHAPKPTILGPDGRPIREAELPADLNAAGVRAALADVKVTVDGIEVPILDVIAHVRCRPGKPMNGCQGKGFSLRRGVNEERAELTLCGCTTNGWRRANSRVPTPILTTKQAQQEEERDTRARERVDRKLGAKAKVEAELAELLERVGTEVSSAAHELAVAQAQVSSFRAAKDEAVEWIQNLDQRIAEMKKLRVEAEKKRDDATFEEQAAGQRAADWEDEVERIRGAHGSEERALRRRIEKLGNRAQRIIERHPEAAAAAG